MGQDMAGNAGKPLLCHINLARGFRGGERQTELLVQGLAQRGWRQRVIVRRNEPLAGRIAAIPGVELRDVAGNPLAAAFAARGAAVTHAHEARAAQASWLLHRLGGAPYVVTRRVDNPIKPSWVTRDLYSRAATVAPVSAAIGRIVTDYVPVARCQPVHDAHAALQANRGEAERIRASYPGKVLVGHVGALDDSHKGQLDIIEMARRLRKVEPRACFLLVGSGRDEARMREAARDLDNVKFTGFVDNVADYLAAFDIFVFPSRHEGLGSTLLDAMALGLPVIATRVGGIPEIIKDGENGFLVDAGDVDTLVAETGRLLQDPDLRERIGRSNMLAAKTYTVQQMALRYDRIYTRILALSEG
jgi:glycosyltransferase involved in cell wall biosynthesis